MAKLAVLDKAGKKVSDIELNDGIFAIEPNMSAMHLMVVSYLAAQRQGTQSTLTRSEVSGGGKKPWRQKGTGRARQGSTRSPQWTHGGIALGPKPREYGIDVNKKVKRLAMKSALSSKVAENEMIVVDSLAMDAIKTKEMAGVLSAINAGKKTLIVLPEKDDVVYRSARNIAGAKVSLVNTLNVYDILNCNTIVVVKDAVSKIEEVYA
ncbi:MAG: 50S ribosomal protein L4 [Ruminococcus sp.]|jgi:large subunit ribosomal protein L4|nr:50S ribosomal protein L4 [Oscillospiraceae bacterium]MCI6387780.1 50S ribosomal protein L4 [Ruminococcus sp.]MDY4909110.1 50S ribosomal protein L4 [Candidatus Fimenecus sp.]MDD6270604.1 50S ribosomal protein L4 [Ruminococcus sp.]MDD7344356.1 50S ribosomal protein L4 [Ruminococcus sp.]